MIPYAIWAAMSDEGRGRCQALSRTVAQRLLQTRLTARTSTPVIDETALRNLLSRIRLG